MGDDEFVFEGHAYRVVAEGVDPLDTTRAALYGGRCHCPGRDALYFSLAVQGAVSESLQVSARYGIGPFKPRLLVAVECRLSRTLNAEDFLPAEQLSASWRSGALPTAFQSWAEAMAGKGVSGIVYPSVIEEGVQNVVVFPHNLGEGDRLLLISSE